LVWSAILRLFPTWMGDHLIFAVGTWATTVFVFWFWNIILFVFYYFNIFPKQRINKGAMPPQALINECLLDIFINQFIINPPLLYFLYPAFTACGVTLHGPLPDMKTILRDFVVCIALNDTFFYWAHRILHHPSIYQHIHKKHHRFNYTIGIASVFAHPVENVLANLLPTLAGCLFMGSHVFTLWLWLALRITETVDAHSGYEFTFSPFSLLPFQGGADRHDFHHSKNVGCYGSFTIFWDYITGSDQAYLEFKKKQAEKQDEKTVKKTK